MTERDDDHGHRAVYDCSATEWSTHRSGSVVERRWLDLLTAGLAPGAAVLDLGCGTGVPVASHLRVGGFTVTGVDFSHEMLRLARQTCPDGIWVEADMRALPDLGAFDAIVAWDSLFHLRINEQCAVLRDLALRLNPGGRLMFTSGTVEGEVWGAVSGGPVWHASMSPGGYLSVLEPSGLVLRRFVAEDHDAMGRTVWLLQLA